MAIPIKAPVAKTEAERKARDEAVRRYYMRHRRTHPVSIVTKEGGDRGRGSHDSK